MAADSQYGNTRLLNDLPAGQFCRSDDKIRISDATSCRRNIFLNVTRISNNGLKVICAKDIPSLALRTAIFKPKICVLKRLYIYNPAVPSLALLILKPDDKRSKAVFKLLIDLNN